MQWKTKNLNLQMDQNYLDPVKSWYRISIKIVFVLDKEEDLIYIKSQLQYIDKKIKL